MISLCITTYNRHDLLLQSFEQVLYDSRISEIVIVDDCSDEKIYKQVEQELQGMPRVKLFRNIKNLDCYLNKAQAIRYATNDWCILLDSDNIITTDYIDALEAAQVNGKWNNETIYAPEFAMPQFNYKKFKGLMIDRSNVSRHLEAPFFQILLNTCNFFVNREEYLLIFDNKVNPHTADTIYQNLNWLKADNKIYVVPDLKYHHRLHDGSHFENNNHKTKGFLKHVINQLKALS